MARHAPNREHYLARHAYRSQPGALRLPRLKLSKIKWERKVWQEIWNM